MNSTDSWILAAIFVFAAFLCSKLKETVEMTDSNETIQIGYENPIVKLMRVIDKNQQMLLDMHKILTPLLTPRFDNPSFDEKKRELDRENLARKTVLIEKMQNLLDAHYGWENENAIDD